MIIENQDDLTRAVLAEVARTPDPRLRRILASAVQHLHGFVHDTELTEAEFRPDLRPDREGRATHHAVTQRSRAGRRFARNLGARLPAEQSRGRRP
jgi:hypothetical protein